MNILLLVFILISVILHLAEHFLAKFKQVSAWINLAFHGCSLLAFLFLQLDLNDLFLFLLCSGLLAIFLKYKEEQHGI